MGASSAIHPTRGAAEWTLTVVCVGGVHAGDLPHDERTVDVLHYWPTPDDAPLGYLNWLSSQGSLQTPFGEVMAAEQRSGATVDLGGWAGTPRGMHHATRWRFECPDCATVPVAGEKMDVILDLLRQHDVRRISLRGIAGRAQS